MAFFGNMAVARLWGPFFFGISAGEHDLKAFDDEFFVFMAGD